MSAAFVGVLGGIWFALLNDSIEVFQNYIDGSWRHQISVRSFAAPIVGTVIGALAGANIYLALPPDRAYGFTRGALIGAAVGVALALAQVALVALAAIFDDYRVFYQPLLTRFSGILFTATAIGAAANLLMPRPRPASSGAGAVLGAFIAAAFVLPSIATTLLTISTSEWVGSAEIAYFMTHVAASHLSTLLAGTLCGSVVVVVFTRVAPGKSHNLPTTVGVLLGTVTAVTASSPSFNFVVLGLVPPESSFSLALYVFRTLVGLLFGILVGLVAAFAMRKTASGRTADGVIISPD